MNLKDIFSPVKLNTQIAQLTTRIKELETGNGVWLGKYELLESAYNNLKNDTEAAMQAKSEYDATILAKDTAYTELVTNHGKAISTLIEDHTGVINGLKSENETKISELVSGHSTKISELVSGHSTKISELIKDKELALTELTNKHKEAITKLEQSIITNDQIGNAKAAEILALIGVPENTISSKPVVEVNAQAVLNKYIELTNSDKVAADKYYNENRLVLMSAVNYKTI